MLACVVASGVKSGMEGRVDVQFHSSSLVIGFIIMLVCIVLCLCGESE